MGTDLSEWIAHPVGEQPEVEEWSAVADTFAGRVPYRVGHHGTGHATRTIAVLPMQDENRAVTEETQPTPRKVRLLGFITGEEIGLGDAVKRVTYAMGIQPCGGCERRGAA